MVPIAGCTETGPPPENVPVIEAGNEGVFDGFGSAEIRTDDSRPAKSWAVVVGINDYEGSWRPLRTAVNDALHVRNMLRDEFGFGRSHLRLLLNAEAHSVKGVIQELIESDEVGQNDSFVFYFAGHGTDDGLLACVDSVKGQASRGMLSVQEVRDWLNQSRFLHKAVILDSCFSGAIFDQNPPTVANARSTGVFIGLTAARRSDFSFDGGEDSGFSPFTRHLLDIFTERANSREADHVFTLSQVAVEMEARFRKQEKGETAGHVKPSGEDRLAQPAWGYLGPGEGKFVFRETRRRLTPLEQTERRRERQEQTASSRRFVVASRGCRESHPQRSLLLAAEAIEAIDPAGDATVTEAHQNLWDALAEIGGRPLSASGNVRCCVLSTDGQWCFGGTEQGDVLAWNLLDGDPQRAPVLLAKHQGPVEDIAVHPNGEILVTGSQDETIRIVYLGFDDQAVSAEKRVVRLHKRWVSDVAFSSDGNWLASASLDGLVRLWDISDQSIPDIPIVLKGHTGEVRDIYGLEFTPDSRYLVTASSDFTACLWAVASAAEATVQPTVLRGHKDSVRCVAVSPNSRQIATGDSTGEIYLWNIDSAGKIERQLLDGHRGGIRSLEFGPDGHLLLSGSGDQTARLWEVAGDPAHESRVLTGHSEAVTCVAFSPNGDLAATGSYDQTIRLWKVASKPGEANPSLLRGHEGSISSILFRNGGKELVSVGDTIRKWTIEPHAHSAAVGSWEVGKGGYSLLSPSGKWLVHGTPAGDVVLRSGADSGYDAAQLIQGLPKGLRLAAFSTNERWLATGTKVGGVSLFDLSAESPVDTSLELRIGEDEDIALLTFTADGTRLVCVCRKSKHSDVTVWNVGRAAVSSAVSVRVEGVGKWRTTRNDRWLLFFDNFAKRNARLWELDSVDGEPILLDRLPNSRRGWELKNRRWLVMANSAGAHIWDTDTNAPETHRFEIQNPADEDFELLAVSPDDSLLVLATGGILDTEHVIWVYQFQNGSTLGRPHRLPNHTLAVTAIAFDDAGHRMATAGRDNTIRIWELGSTDLRASCQVLQDSIAAQLLSFSTDGMWLVSESGEYAPRLWSLRLEDGASPTTPLLENGNAHVLLPSYVRLRLTPDSRYLICRRNGVEEIQPLRADDLVRLAKRIAGRDLTETEKVETR